MGISKIIAYEGTKIVSLACKRSLDVVNDTLRDFGDV